MLKDKWTQQINEQKHGNIDSDTTGETNLIDSEPRNPPFSKQVYFDKGNKHKQSNLWLICMHFNIHIHVVNKVKKKNIL